MTPFPAIALRWALCTTLALGGVVAGAACSRPIVVPVAPTGFNIQVDQERVFGVYPDWLREMGSAVGCSFEFPVVPRARATAMVFNTHQADILVPASQNAERDQKALFVHFLDLTPNLITLSRTPERVTDVQSLVRKTGWRAAMVRSYSWGDAYETLVRELEADKRIDFVNDLETVGRMLRMGRVQFTILPPTLLFSALQEGRPTADASEFRFTRLEGLPRSRVGAYLSRQSLAPADVDGLRDALIKAARDGTLKHSLHRYYPADVIRADVVLHFH